jgi:hypothetical protein
VTWDEYKSEEFDLDENEDEDIIAADPERIEVRDGSFINNVAFTKCVKTTKRPQCLKSCKSKHNPVYKKT